MEFLNYRYASLMLTWDMNGRLLNRIPVVKRWHWREFLAVRTLWGKLSEKNQYTELPEGAHAMDPEKPYVEVMAGIHNIFKFFNVEYQGKKSVISVRVSEIYGVPEEQVLLAYGGEEILKNAIHYFLMKGDNKKILIPEFSWWYYNKVASECGGTFEMYPLYEQEDTFAYNVDEVIEYTNRIHPRMLLLASPNNPTGNSLTSEEIGRIMENIPSDTMVLVDEAYASFITTDTDYIAPLVNKYENLIISRTLSKFYGLPGLRCGFGFIGKGHDQFLSYSNKYLGFNRFSEAVALAALDSDEHYRHVADEMEWGRQLYKKELGHLPGFKVYKSVANFILIKYPIAIKERLMEALKVQDYKIKFMGDPGLESCLRITLGRREQTQTVVDTIKKVLSEK